MTLLAVVLAACGLFLVLGVAKPWSSGAADGFVAVDDEMRRMLETAEAEEKPAQPPKQGEAATASESREAVPAQGVGQAGAAGTPQSAEAAEAADGPKPQGGGSSVPSAGSPPASQSPAASSAALLNLNQATAEQLDALPGIGPSRAAAIIELRRKQGGAFRSLDELLEIKGIGEKSLQKLKPLLTL
ncbi:helix-hairpin-helix domain-containing protein [Paenibacillus mucilaginosus]|nr:helix-hairpin-helix domain-containing protein [Paenibacillus mucilaginosus]WDM31386.1 helix-hairpin-helix domain-containing protein [Paenibacillus mucilaginosus]